MYLSFKISAIQCIAHNYHDVQYGGTLIKTLDKPACIICGTKGHVIYKGLSDHLFNAPGEWNVSKCPNPECGLMWLNPMPLAADIGKAYEKYYTHQEPFSGKNTLAVRLKNAVSRAYLSIKYGYHNPPMSIMCRFLSFITFLHPLQRLAMEQSIRDLSALNGGTLLDVGCGNGDWLDKMQKLGWQVEGVDFDPSAIKCAEAKGLSVRLGSVEEQGYPDNSFDAVVANHVIEHVHCPLDLLSECHRIVKPGGRIIVTTPNTSSLGHSIYKSHWRGLEPPRHLYMMNMKSMIEMANKANLKIDFLKTMISSSSISLLYGSHALKKGVPINSGKFTLTKMDSLSVRMLALLEWLLLKIHKDRGEVLFLSAKKQQELEGSRMAQSR